MGLARRLHVLRVEEGEDGPARRTRRWPRGGGRGRRSRRRGRRWTRLRVEIRSALLSTTSRRHSRQASFSSVCSSAEMSAWARTAPPPAPAMGVTESRYESVRCGRGQGCPQARRLAGEHALDPAPGRRRHLVAGRRGARADLEVVRPVPPSGQLLAAVLQGRLPPGSVDRMDGAARIDAGDQLLEAVEGRRGEPRSGETRRPRPRPGGSPSSDRRWRRRPAAAPHRRGIVCRPGSATLRSPPLFGSLPCRSPHTASPRPAGLRLAGLRVGPLR